MEIGPPIQYPFLNTKNQMTLTKQSCKHLFHLLAACALATLLGGCAATKVEQTWKSPDLKSPVGKIAVLAIEDRGLVRQGFENRCVRQLAKTGAPAVATFDLLSLPDIKEDKRAAAERFRAAGAQAILIMRLAGSAGTYHESRAGNEQYAATITGIESMGWYDYYSVGFVDMGVTYGNTKQVVYVEVGLYDLSTEKRLWYGQTQTVLKEGMDRVSEMDPLVHKFVAAMRRDGVVR
jgi:hypothetical protein